MRVGQAKRRRFLAGALASFVGLFGAAALASRTAAQPVDPPADSPWVPEPEAPAPPAAEPEGEFVPSGVRPAKLAIPKLGVEAPITRNTCGGEYRAASREYLDSLVVRAKGA